SRNYRAMTTIDVKEEEEELYLAINPKGNFVVEFVLLKNGGQVVFRMFKVIEKEKSNNKDHLDKDYDNSLSSKKLSLIKDFPKQLSFMKDQSNLIEPKNNILSWSIAVTDKLSSHNSHVRILAISCISIHDMTLDKFIEGTKKPEFTIAFIINEDYFIEKEELI
ncbi:9050_t:CDS:2, partial [Gigaspora margarita]